MRIDLKFRLLGHHRKPFWTRNDLSNHPVDSAIIALNIKHYSPNGAMKWNNYFTKWQKKSFKTFGRMKINTYLCTAFEKQCSAKGHSLRKDG